MTDQVEIDEEDFEVLLTQNARVEVTLGTQFTYRGTTHYPKVSIHDGPFVLPVEPENDGDEPSFEFEDGESVVYRVSETAHRLLEATIARMKREIDSRMSADPATATRPSI